jgi:hypothetical protein
LLVLGAPGLPRSTTQPFQVLWLLGVQFPAVHTPGVQVAAVQAPTVQTPSAQVPPCEVHEFELV